MPEGTAMAGKQVLITGGNSGIGLETAVGLARLGATVSIVSRDRARGEAAVDEIRRRGAADDVRLFVADLSARREVRRLAADVDAALPRLDVLVNNAGAIVGEHRLTEDGLETTFAVNHLAYFLLTQLLLDKLRASAPSRIVNVASNAHRRTTFDISDLQFERGYNSWKAYCSSKFANIIFTYELAHRLEGTGVTVNCLHPGVVATNFGRSGTGLFRLLVGFVRPLLINSERGAATSIYLASSPEVEGVTGKYFVNSREARSTDQTYDRDLWHRLWEESERLTAS